MPSENINIPSNTGPRPWVGGLVGLELLRALWNALLLPLHAIGHLIRRQKRKDEVREDLVTGPLFVAEGELPELPKRPLRIFVSCAEASGETHACNLVLAVQRLIADAGAPPAEFFGLGGERFAATGVEILGDPVSEARMGFSGIIGALPFYLGLVRSAAEAFASGEVDLFIGVDSPALHVPLAHIARRCGIPTVQFIAPQYWGWAPWRVSGFRASVDLALTILPFEPAWFTRHSIAVAHVGHPLLDEIEQEGFIPSAPEPGRAPLLVLLPGSRRSVIERNLPLMLSALEALPESTGPWLMRVCQRDGQHRELIEECIERSGMPASRIDFSLDLERELSEATAALSVSGTILTNLLNHSLPTVVVYALESRMTEWIGRNFLTVPWFSSVNLLAGREVYPEFSFSGSEVPSPWLAAIKRLLEDEIWRSQCKTELGLARKRLGPAGASRRAALAALGILAKK
ncbi:MAG: lipid-A-disaccharide synthase [Planctomycetota bacterium]|jgi:lipid-A-disaccharide synthase